MRHSRPFETFPVVITRTPHQSKCGPNPRSQTDDFFQAFSLIKCKSEERVRPRPAEWREVSPTPFTGRQRGVSVQRQLGPVTRGADVARGHDRGK
jgi:hypothetical protein